MEKKNMYIVIKQEDVKKYLSQEEIHMIGFTCIVN